MRVTLIYHGRYLVRQALELETLANVIRHGGHTVRMVYDPDAFGVSDNLFQVPRLARWLNPPGRMVEQIVASCPEVCIFSVLPASYPWCRRIAQAVAARIDVPIVFIGLHPSLVPERVLRDAFVTAVVQGEAESVIQPLLDALASGGDLSGVNNLWYRRDGSAIATPRADLVDLDALPLPDKTLFYPYVSHAFSYAAMVSRGCPYACSFCEETCSKRLYGSRYYRRRSVDGVMAELLAGQRNYRYREVIFKDSYLSGDKRWLAELMDRYRTRIGVPFKCFCTVHSFDGETARLLKEGGCYSVEFGLQTWNAATRRNVLHRTETNEAALEAFAHCAEQQLWYDVDHMFGLPGETEQDHIEGARRYRGLRYLNRVKVHHLVYLPTADIVDHGLAAEALPVDVREQLADGCESDFYDQGQAAGRNAHRVRGYATLYKLLPLLPHRFCDWLLQDSRAGLLRHFPAPVLWLLQGILALRSGDLRFLAYIRFYPVKIARIIAARLRRRAPATASPIGVPAP